MNRYVLLSTTAFHHCFAKDCMLSTQQLSVIVLELQFLQPHRNLMTQTGNCGRIWTTRLITIVVTSVVCCLLFVVCLLFWALSGENEFVSPRVTPKQAGKAHLSVSEKSDFFRVLWKNCERGTMGQQVIIAFVFSKKLPLLLSVSVFVESGSIIFSELT